MMTKKRTLLFFLLIPVVCVVCVGMLIVALYIWNQLRWRDDLMEIASEAEPGDYEVTLKHDGRDRNYRLHLPPAYDGTTELPLVIVLHGASGNADISARMTGFDSKADAEGFIVVHPNGTGRLPNQILTWNAGGCCGYAIRKNADDIGFLRALIERLSAELAVDAERIYITGMSNGGMMSLAAACELDDLIAGVGSVVGAMIWQGCEPEQPVHVIMINGTGDHIVRYEGGWLENPGSIDDSVHGAIISWTGHNGCGEASTSELEGLVIDEHENCANGSIVKLVTVIGGGHAWYGGRKGWPTDDDPSSELSATDVLWEFFAAHPKARN